MRVIAGRLRGHVFAAPSGFRTHPMGDRVRDGLFNTLGDITGLRVLDAFAGSGALGFEALSRGATSVLAVEIDKRAQKIIQKNTSKLGFSSQEYHLVCANVSSWSDNNPSLEYDIVFAAPPYVNLQEDTVKKLSKHVAPDGLLVLDWPATNGLPQIKGLELIKSKTYGNAQLGFYKRIQ